MDSNNQNNTGSAFTNVNSTAWNLEKISMETNEHDRNIVLQVQDHQIPMGSGIWPNYNPFQIPPSSNNSASLGDHMEEEEEGEEELGAMKEMMYKIAAMQPVDIDPATIRKPKRRNVRISDDPQSVAARHRRERISEKIRILQRLVPGGTKMDTASMLDEAIRYVKFLKRQIRLLQSTPQPPQCIATAPAPPLLAPPVSCDWPFAPNILLTNSTTAASVDLPAGVGFDGAGGHGHACDASSSFNHHQVISE